jgi:hypothetical protein
MLAFSASRPGRSREVGGNTHPRGMVTATQVAQNPAYRPSDTFFYPHLSQLGFATQTPRYDIFPLQRLRREGEESWQMLIVAPRHAALELPKYLNG